MPIRSTLAMLILAAAAFGTACREEAPTERAVRAVDEAGREANARSPAVALPEPGLEAVDRAAGEAAEVLEEEARGLVDASKQDGAAHAATAAERAREAVDAVETRAGAEKVGDELSENVEDSVRVYDETYDAARERGENPIEAGGEAYDEVLDSAAPKKEEPR